MSAALLLASTLALQAPAAAPQETPRPLDLDRGWEISGDVRVEPHLGRPAIRFRTGRAIRRDVAFENGTIDAQMAVSGRRSFGYVQFRIQKDDEYEEFYLRPHKSELPDALQYAPVFRGESYWQFFHGPGGTAPVELPRDRWIPVRVVVEGSRAALFVGDLTTPRLVVPRLARDTVKGVFALNGFLPAGAAPEGEYPVSYSEIVVRPGFVAYDFSKRPPPAAAPPGSISRWSVSPSFEPPPGPLRALPKPAGEWGRLDADPAGRVLLFRDRARLKPRQRVAVLSRVTLQAASDGERRLNVGFSDEVTVFLDGRPLFSGDAIYRFDNPRQEGLITLSQATVYLPLRKGPNELVLAVADVFGGWGFAAQLDGEGVSVAVEGKEPSAR